MFSFYVEGEPAPQGSKNGFVKNGRVVMVEASKKVRPWRDAVTKQTQLAMRNRDMITTPVELTLVFHLPRPKTVLRGFPSVKPDLDKLIRSTFDGLTSGGLYKDDALVIAVTATKTYATDKVGCYIHVASEVGNV